MKLTWLGHACFLLEEQGYRIVIDPYEGVAGYPPLQVSAHAVFCSHGHFDHNAVNCVTLLPETESPFSVREVQTFHDDQNGALRARKYHPHLHGGRRVCSPSGRSGPPADCGAATGDWFRGRCAGAGGRCVHLGRCRGKSGVRRAAPRMCSPHALSPRTLRPAGAGRGRGVPEAVAGGGGSSAVRRGYCRNRRAFRGDRPQI